MPNDTISMDNFLSESNIIEPPTAIHLRVGEESTTLSSRCKTSEEAQKNSEEDTSEDKKMLGFIIPENLLSEFIPCDDSG